MEPKGTLLVLGRPKGHIRGPKGHSALWKRPSENPALKGEQERGGEKEQDVA